MPLMRVTLTPGAFDATQKARLAVMLTEAACRAESVPDLPQHRMRALVLLDELDPGCFYFASQPADAAVAGVSNAWLPSFRVLDRPRTALFSQGLPVSASS